jgi:hypothetical protein
LIDETMKSTPAVVVYHEQRLHRHPCRESAGEDYLSHKSRSSHAFRQLTRRSGAVAPSH